jgi:hypothetical protein
MSWVDAIKAYAEKSKGKFAIPKRDSPEYAAIRKIQEDMAKGVVPAPKKKKRAVAAVAPVVEVPVVAAPKVTKPKVARHENVAEPEPESEPVREVKVYKKRRVVPKHVEVPEAIEEEVVIPEVKVVRRKIIKHENQEPEPAPEPKPEVKKMTTIQEERAAKRAEKHARLEEQSKKAGEYALAQARVMMSKTPIVLDFS